MAIELTQEQIRITTDTLRNNDLHSEVVSADLLYDEREIIPGDSQEHTPHEYELSISESLSFLYNLLYDENSYLTKSDILKILNCLKRREDKLTFSIDSDSYTDTQGVMWPRGLKKKFYQDRLRVGTKNWFRNMPGSREDAIKRLKVRDYNLATDFFSFRKFYGKLKLHMTHFQLRNLVCSGPNVLNGIFYPSSHCVDYGLDYLFTSSDATPSYFKINRLMPDDLITENSRPMKLDCLIDSRYLMKNTNNRISTLACSNKFLACGTFEGGYILENIENPNEPQLLGEHKITNNTDGITNHIIIRDEKDLILSSNDKSIRIIDISTNVTDTKTLPFAVNCASVNPWNKNEIFITGDNISSFILDLRQNVDIDRLNPFKGHKDFGFSCDWSPREENLLLTGNQDGCVSLWDRRKHNQSLYSWDGSLGSSVPIEGPVRNCKFSNTGDYISWAESLDHVGILETDDLKRSDINLDRIQSIEFVGKCIGMSFCPIDDGLGEQLIIGVNDNPLGGILTYDLESKTKSLDFDFAF